VPDIDDDARLAAAFAEFRREVAPYVAASGTAAAHARVGRRRRARVGAFACVAALLVGGPAVGFAAANGDTPAPPVIVPSPTPSVTTSPTPSGTPLPTRTSAEPTKAPALPPVTGKVFYTDVAGKLYLDGRRYPGGDPASLNVSPDGKRLTWVQDGDLVMSDVDGRNRRTAHYGVDQLCVQPVWSGDATRLLFASIIRGGLRLGIAYLAGGAGDHLREAEGCHYRWSADGKRLAYLHGDLNGLTVHDVYGGNRVTLDRADIGGRQYADLVGISADGGRACVLTVGKDGPWGDVARSLWCDTIVDVARKKPVDLPVDGTLRSAVFLADGGMLARVETGEGYELVRLDADDRVVARSAESAADAGRMLLAYTP